VISASWEHLLSSPDLYPLELDFRARRITFAPMSRAAYQASSFLDFRILACTSERVNLPLSEVLPLLLLRERPALRPVRFIFHTAYCCSTLLARYLEVLPSCFVLKEPQTLTQLAALEAFMRNTATVVHDPSDLGRMLELCMMLLGRTYNAEEVVIIKTSDACNAFAKTLLGRDFRSRAIFVTTSLTEFLLSVLKSPERRRWLRARLIAAVRDAAAIPKLRGFVPSRMSDAIGGAYLWLLNQELRMRLCDGAGERVLVATADQISDTPELAVCAATEHLILPHSCTSIKEILSGPASMQYSKDQSKSYSAELRRRELAALGKQFGAEVATGIEWAVQHSPSAGLCKETKQP
jgi:hypothetical protein